MIWIFASVVLVLLVCSPGFRKVALVLTILAVLAFWRMSWVEDHPARLAQQPSVIACQPGQVPFDGGCFTPDISDLPIPTPEELAALRHHGTITRTEPNPFDQFDPPKDPSHAN